MQNGTKRCALGVDLGGTKIRAALVNDKGVILETLKVSTDSSKAPQTVEQQIVTLTEALGRQTDCRPVGMGVGVAGQVQRQTGLVRFAPNLEWHDVSLQADLEKKMNLPVKVINDVRAATWGEWRFGAGQGMSDLVCLFVGTGVGGGIVSGGRLLSGHANTAGELGHITINLHGPICTCGNQGCLEAMAGGWAIARKAREIVRTHPDAGNVMLELVGHQPEFITAQTVARAFEKNDPAAVGILGEATEALISGVVSMVNLLSPQCLILGGGVIDGIPELIPRVAEGVRQRSLATALESFRIVPAQLGRTAGVIGAAGMFLEGIPEAGK